MIAVGFCLACNGLDGKIETSLPDPRIAGRVKARPVPIKA